MTRSGPVLAAMLACAPAQAFAHAFLEHASPGAGARVTPPGSVTLDFSEALEPAFSGASVTDAKGRAVGGVATIGGATIAIPLPALVPGKYHVRWHAVSVDTHRTDGAYDFVVRP